MNWGQGGEAGAGAPGTAVKGQPQASPKGMLSRKPADHGLEEGPDQVSSIGAEEVAGEGQWPVWLQCLHKIREMATRGWEAQSSARIAI